MELFWSRISVKWVIKVYSQTSRKRRSESEWILDATKHRVAQNGTVFWYALTSSNINRFSKLFHCQNHEKMCNNTITKDPTTPYVCRYARLWLVNIKSWIDTINEI